MAAARQASVRGLHCSANNLLCNCPSSLQAESTAHKFSYICVKSSKCRAHTSELANRSSPFFGTSVKSSIVSDNFQWKKVWRSSNQFKAALAEAPETATAPPSEIAVHNRKSGSVALVALGKLQFLWPAARCIGNGVENANNMVQANCCQMMGGATLNGQHSANRSYRITSSHFKMQPVFRVWLKD
jgi:hypothetical protein